MAQLKTDLEKEQLRSDQSENRWMRVVAQMKDELKQQEQMHKKQGLEKEAEIRALKEALATAQGALMSSEQRIIQLQNDIEQNAAIHEHIEAHNQSLLNSLANAEARLDHWQQHSTEQLKLLEAERRALHTPQRCEHE